MQYGKLKTEKYKTRIVDTTLERMLDIMSAVEVAGTMWCGKTWTSLAHGNSVARIGQSTVRLAADADPATALIGDKPHVIDEWQDVPAIWDEVRADIDLSGSRTGQYILTGSSRPQKDKVSHSGAGRIGKLKMRTMSLYETGDSSGEVSLSGLFNGSFEPMQVQQKLQPVAEYICRGGWPAIICSEQRDSSLLLDGYFDAVFSVNMPKRNLKGDEARRVSISLARNLGSAVRLSTVAMDAGFDGITDKAAADKANTYIEALSDMYITEDINGWDAPIRSKSRLRTKPKRYFADPSLAASLLQITPERLINDGQTFGVLFESLCIHDLAVYASAMTEAQAEPLRYYRDADGLETDVIIELRDGRWAAIEIKLGENKVKDAAASLHRLCNKISLNPAARNSKPEFLAVIVGAGEYARYDKENGVYIIPLTVLGP